VSEVWNKAQKFEAAYWSEALSKEADWESRFFHGRSVHEIIWRRFGVAPMDWSGKVVVDIGCGPTGRLSSAVNATKIAIDPLWDDYQAMQGANCADYTHGYSLPAEQFVPELEQIADVVVCLNALDHCDDPLVVIENMWRYCKPNGVGFLSTDCDYVEDDLFHPSRMDAASIERVASRAGWTLGRRMKGKCWPVIEDGVIKEWWDSWAPGIIAYHWWMWKEPLC
jgi:SAM-dependent methyltransferase